MTRLDPVLTRGFLCAELVSLGVTDSTFSNITTLGRFLLMIVRPDNDTQSGVRVKVFDPKEKLILALLA